MSTDRKTAPLVTSSDEQSFEATFKRYYPLVYQLAYRWTGRHDEAEDIAQEVFLRFYHMPPHATSEGEQRAWLCRVATNLSLNALRTRQRRTHREEQVGEMNRHEMSGDSAYADPEQQVQIRDRKSTRLNSSHQIISYAVFCLKKKKKITRRQQ